MKTEKQLQKLSVFISLILRHKPETINVTVDCGGWVCIDELVEGLNRAGRNTSVAEIHKIVFYDKKGRYSIANNKIRANQGHSLKHVDVGLEIAVPPEQLYHGTSEKSIESIMNRGLDKMTRQHVHLSQDIETASQVGSRRKSALVLLVVDTQQMRKDGFEFFVSVNGVWLTDHVPVKYIEIIKEE